MDGILDAVLKVENSSGEIKDKDGIVNNKFEAAEKRVTDYFADEFKGKINDETDEKVSDKKMKSLTQTVLGL